MMLLKLYIAFFQIGMFAFGGGYVILPLIEEFIVNKYTWVSSSTLLDIISISQVTPGPIAINAATFIGMNNYGVIGSVVATIGVISPQIILLTIFIKYIGFENKIMMKIIDGIKPATISLIFIATLNIMKKSMFVNFANSYKMEYVSLVCFFVAIILMKFKFKMRNIIFICALISIII
ncbi:chromate transporter [Streptobacillus felis]|uniref:Chromate transporter n=1 Tax=Streptobacillus felis TaxID=1384509 RepID=A0A7Z0PGD8_9FUSO|nr:chromate transporter [Streptobacillus felis]NYV28276.1 chromate transporter [Streptobacillus felis]